MRTAIAALLLLSGCAEVVQTTPAGGILKVAGNEYGKALSLAQAECQKYGKNARISGQNPLNNTVTYDCVP
jgi:hypothetical protein